MSKRRITMAVLQSESPDSIREIEMAVDAAVFYQGISIQFWTDVRLYGLHEACLYLRNYADTEKVAAIMVICDAIIERLNNSLRPAPQPEGNGWDEVET